MSPGLECERDEDSIKTSSSSGNFRLACEFKLFPKRAKGRRSRTRQDPSFADDLSQLCIALGNALSNALPDEKPTTGAKRDPWVNKVYRVIQRKRISKRDLVSALQRIPIDVPMSFAETRTTLEILEYVKQNMPRSTLEKVLSQLNSRAAEGDAYLEGILKRTPED